MKVEFRPLYDRVLIRRMEGEDVTPGGIFIPQNAKEKPMRGTVVSVGTGKIQDDGSIRDLAVQKGDEVLFGPYSGNEIKVDGEVFLIMREDEILGVVEAR